MLASHSISGGTWARSLYCTSSSPEISAKGIAAPGLFAERRPPCRFWMPDFGTKKRNRHGGRRSGQKAGAYAPPLRGADRCQAIPLALISGLVQMAAAVDPDAFAGDEIRF